MTGRYSRQELFHGIGKKGQQRLRESCVAIVGCGALGSMQAEAVVRAGIGRLILIDRDFVEPSNLQRQSLFSEKDAADSVPKAIAATARLREINADTTVQSHVADLNPDNTELLKDAHLILDGTDNFQTRYLLNDLSWKMQIPWIYGACVGSTGIASAFVPDKAPCLRCLFEQEPPAGSAPTCDTAGIIWPAVSAVVSYQVAAAFKLLCEIDISPQIYQLDVWESSYRIISIAKAKRSDCSTCGTKTFPSLDVKGGLETSLCGRDAVQIKPPTRSKIDLDAMHSRWKPLGETYRNAFLLKLRMPDVTIVLFPDGRAMIQGTTDTARARDLYAKFIGM